MTHVYAVAKAQKDDVAVQCYVITVTESKHLTSIQLLH